MFDLEWFMDEGEGGGAGEVTPPVVPEIVTPVVPEAPPDKRAPILADLKEAKGEEPVKDEPEKKERVRGEDGKFIKADAKEEAPDGKEDETKPEDPPESDVQARWQAHLDAQPKPDEPKADTPETKTETPPAQVPEKVQTDSPPAPLPVPEFIPFTLLTDEDITDSQDGLIFKDMVPMKDAFNRLAENANQTIGSLVKINAEQKTRLDELEPIVKHLAYLEQTKTLESIESCSNDAASLIAEKYGGLKIDPMQIQLAVSRTIRFYNEQGFLPKGKTPDAKTMVRMWETLNQSQLEGAGIAPIAKTEEAQPEDAKTETEKKAPRLPKGGGNPPSGPMEPATKRDQIMKDLRDARKL